MRYEELLEWSGMSTNEGAFRQMLETACGLALIRPANRNHEYSIHSLLYEFTCSPPTDLRSGPD